MDALKENEKGDEYLFLVLGDARGNFAVEKELIKQVSKKINFAVVLGDAADSNTASHKYLRETMQCLNLNFPFFYVPGNNDFKNESPKRNYLENFTAKDFENHYGPLFFSFTYHNDLFLSICSVGDKGLEDASINFLKSFENKRKNYRHCFVFMHIAPSVPIFDAEKIFATNKFITLFEKLNVTYVLAGHFHGYQSTNYHGINYIITGGGGSPLDSGDFRQFYHAIEFKVGKKAVSQRFVYAPGNIDFSDWLKIRTVLHVIPFCQKNIFLVYSITILTILSCLFLGWKIFTGLFNKRINGKPKLND